MEMTENCQSNFEERTHSDGLHYLILRCITGTSQSLLKLVSIESMMPSNHLILCCLLLLLPSIFPSIKAFSSELALCIRWPGYWSFSFSISSSNEYSGLVSFCIDCLIPLLSKGFSRVFTSTRVRKHEFFSGHPSLWSNSHICT